ncbi:MAG TPA: DUF4082 domain-containing protein [Stellaceae bacterium]|nr:DUF4082 domain-containing protein [Stellaceae bacterium]
MKYFSKTPHISGFTADTRDPRGRIRRTASTAVAACEALSRATHAGRLPIRRRKPGKLGALLAIMGIAWLGGSGSVMAQSVNLFGNTTPNNPAENDPNAVTLGVKFWSSQSGTISAIRFYRGATSPYGYVASLYSASGSLLGSVKMKHESGPVPGWQVATFASPIPVSANKTYVAAYYAPSGRYADVYYGLSNGVTTGPLNAPASATVGGNGVYVYAHAFPNQTWEDSNYFVDVLFTPTAAAPYLKLSFNPANPSIPSNAPAGTVVATVTASWSDGSPFTGTLSFAAPYSNDNGTFALSGNNLIVSPTGPGLSADSGTTQSVTIVATQ